MPIGNKQYLIFGVVLLVAIAFLTLVFTRSWESEKPKDPTPVATTTEPVVPAYETSERIGTSVEGRDITATRFGNGSTTLLFVGGVHGGYEWNSIILAYEMMEYLREDVSRVPNDLSVHIIPNLNPDGLYAVAGTTSVPLTESEIPNPDTRVAAGRFNANDVDLNRNFDCNWAPESTWRGQTVSAGTKPFSEPEAAALRDYISVIQPTAAVFWHSRANNVYASECNDGVLPETLAVMNTYAEAANYGAVPSFDAYPITGDVEGWLASEGIPAITVELETANSIEWERNIAGTEALFSLYTQEENLAR